MPLILITGKGETKISLNVNGPLLLNGKLNIYFRDPNPLITNERTSRAIYTKRQRQCCDNWAMMLAILFSLKTIESLENGVATHFQVTPLISMRTESLASSQSCRKVVVGSWCKRALKIITGIV